MFNGIFTCICNYVLLIKLLVMEFELKVWFRFMVNGEQEKDFEHYKTEALNVHEAFKFIKQKHFNSQQRIPISYERIILGKGDGNEFKAFEIDKNDPHFNKSLSEIEKEY